MEEQDEGSGLFAQRPCGAREREKYVWQGAATAAADRKRANDVLGRLLCSRREVVVRILSNRCPSHKKSEVTRERAELGEVVRAECDAEQQHEGCVRLLGARHAQAEGQSRDQ